ncbi:MAG: ABC-F family ATP-binding cassette domain-containing protein [Clostridia bacterium]|nr:ABC-F family ATP-binding cassette domain-containing protein [Clostridia bacterium]
MRIFQISGLTHGFAGREIFQNAELMVTDNDHIGLVGQNGCGKSTFLKMLIGQVVPDAWKLEMNSSLRIGYLDQYADINRNGTVYEYLDRVFADLYAINERVTALYDSIGSMTDPDEQMKAIGKAQNLSDYLYDHDFDRIPKKIDSVLAGLGFTESDKTKTAAQLSGGMKTRLILAKLLLSEYDLLVLDEPTNFLDIGYIGWLGEYLSRLQRAYIVISHDRTFLNQVSNKIVEITNHRFRVYEGNYEYYIREKERREALQEQQSAAQEKYIARSEAFVAANLGKSAGGTKAVWLKKMLENLERIPHPEEIVKPQFAFRYQSGATKQILTLQDAEVGYDHAPVLPPIRLEVRRGEKLVFRGFNGIGKTTLLKTIYGDLPLAGGEMRFGEGIRAVFLRQEEDYENNFSHFDKTERRRMGLKGGKKRAVTVMEFAKEYYPEKPHKELQAALFSCGLNEVHFFNPVRTLSGGEMVKLRLCLAMLSPVNLIILDEPTNHLDVYSKEVLMHALEEFPGTVLMTTHDVNADVSWADNVVNLEALFG